MRERVIILLTGEYEVTVQIEGEYNKLLFSNRTGVAWLQFSSFHVIWEINLIKQSTRSVLSAECAGFTVNIPAGGMYIIMRSQLENIQKFAGRIITTNWSSDYPSLCVSLNLKSLSAQRQIQKL